MQSYDEISQPNDREQGENCTGMKLSGEQGSHEGNHFSSDQHREETTQLCVGT